MIIGQPKNYTINFSNKSSIRITRWLSVNVNTRQTDPRAPD